MRWPIDSSELQVRRRSPRINEVTIRRAISLVPIPRSSASSLSSAYSSSKITKPDGVRHDLARKPIEGRLHVPNMAAIPMRQTGDA